MNDPSTELANAAAHGGGLNYLITAATVLGSTIAGAVAGTLRYGDRIKDAEKKVDDFDKRLTAMVQKTEALGDALAEACAEIKAAGDRYSIVPVPEADLRRMAEGVVDSKMAGFHVELKIAREDIARLRDDASARERDGNEKWEALNRVLGRLEQASKTLLGGA